MNRATVLGCRLAKLLQVLPVTERFGKTRLPIFAALGDVLGNARKIQARSTSHLLSHAQGDLA